MVRATNKKFSVELPEGEPITPELVKMVQDYRKAKAKPEAAKKVIGKKAPAAKTPEPAVESEVKAAKKVTEVASGVAPAVIEVKPAGRTVLAGQILKKYGYAEITEEMVAALDVLAGPNTKESKWALRTGRAILQGYFSK